MSEGICGDLNEVQQGGPTHSFWITEISHLQLGEMAIFRYFRQFQGSGQRENPVTTPSTKPIIYIPQLQRSCL